MTRWMLIALLGLTMAPLHAAEPAKKPAPKAPAAAQPCGDKTLCKEMKSCAEARHYLNDCGVSSLDRDDDGIPCESLCKGKRR